MYAELILYDVTLYEPKSRRSVIRSGTSDSQATERLMHQIKDEVSQDRKLLLWLNVMVVIGDKRAKLTQWGGGIPIRDTEMLNRVVYKLQEMGAELIASGQFLKFFSNTDVM